MKLLSLILYITLVLSAVLAVSVAMPEAIPDPAAIADANPNPDPAASATPGRRRVDDAVAVATGGATAATVEATGVDEDCLTFCL
nr:uncharacterized protein LOC128688164 [Cherax quadricarinatus]